jgi:hypothetical protein
LNINGTIKEKLDSSLDQCQGEEKKIESSEESDEMEESEADSVNNAKSHGLFSSAGYTEQGSKLIVSRNERDSFVVWRNRSLLGNSQLFWDTQLESISGFLALYANYASCSRFNSLISRLNNI